MLRWQPSGFSQQAAGARHVVLWVVGFHIFFLIMMLFFGGHDDVHVLIMQTIPPVRVVLNPLAKKLDCSNKQTVLPAAQKKQQPQKQKKSADLKKNNVKKQEVKKTEPVIKPVAQVAEKDRVYTPLTKLEKKKKDTPSPKMKERPAVQEPIPEKKIEEDLAEEEVVIYVGRDDYEGMRIQNLIQQAVREHWTSPAGFDHVSCMVQIALTKTGVVKDVDIKVSSGVFAYDIAARSAAQKACYPKEVWNKKLILQFGKGVTR